MEDSLFFVFQFSMLELYVTKDRQQVLNVGYLFWVDWSKHKWNIHHSRSWKQCL